MAFLRKRFTPLKRCLPAITQTTVIRETSHSGASALASMTTFCHSASSLCVQSMRVAYNTLTNNWSGCHCCADRTSGSRRDSRDSVDARSLTTKIRSATRNVSKQRLAFQRDASSMRGISLRSTRGCEFAFCNVVTIGWIPSFFNLLSQISNTCAFLFVCFGCCCFFLYHGVSLFFNPFRRNLVEIFVVIRIRLSGLY